MNRMDIYKSKRQWLFHIIKKDFKILVSTLIIGVIVSILGLVVSVFSQKFIDEIVPTHDLNKMYIFLCLTIGFLAFKIAISTAQKYLGSLYNKRFNLRLIDQFFTRLLKLPKSFFDSHDTGAVIARMNDSGSIQQTVTFISNTLILNSLILASSSTLLFYYSKVIGYITWLSLPLFFFVAYFSKKPIVKRIHEVMNANENKESNFISTIKNSDLIKTHNKEEYYADVNRKSYGNFQNSIFRSGITGIKVGLVSDIVGTSIYISMFSYAAYQLITGNLTIGAFSATLGIATGMMGPLGDIGFAILQLQGAKVAFERMFEFVSTTPEYYKEEDDKKLKPKNIYSIEFRNVHFSYSKDVELLKDINFKVKKGEVLCFWGENGSGKSTILKLLTLLYKPDYGNILFEGISSKKLSINNIRNRIAVVAQQSKLFNNTIIENICMDSNPEKMMIATKYLNSLGFERIINQLPEGYLTQIHENGENISGGQKQIISLARALIKKPDIMILDEPSASLDGENELFVLDIIKEFKKTGTVIMVSHKHNPAKVADRILLLKNGVIEKVGMHSELITGDNLYSRSYADV